ncbi:3'-5' exoribonuclease [Citrobacter cronae]|uniref:3'-5' exoribonuclease domain-containing protein n=1 Tax=Citrobacter cronae TaxID=1748967 RepID=UPI0021D112B0|nr:3'-5' exoribonuclease [Citrobacter cronae]MCU6182901.1 3'-5' exoribonuclease [Citrobacter cronae]
MLTYAYLIKAKAKATEAKSLFCWFSAKSDSRAEREILNILEDNDIAVGRGADYQLPVRTNWFVVDDLPEESTLDDTWCDRYELAEDQQTWQLKQKPDHENQETSCQQKPETTSANVPTSDVQMEKTDNSEIKANPDVPQGEAAALPVESTDATGEPPASLNNEPVHHIDTDHLNAFYTHLMVDLETMGSGPDAPIVSIGAVYFDPSTGNTGAEFYQVVSLESSMSFGMKPDASTIQWWLKQSSEARSAILVDEAMGLRETLELLADFIAENAANGSHTVQLWGNGCSFDNVILRRAYALTQTPFAVPFWNDRDVRTMVELGKTVGINPRFDIPFEGDMHNALSDARHQVKYVSAIWQRLTKN